MLIGDAALKTPGSAHKVCHRCMPKSGDNSNLNCASPDSQTLPTEFCVGGIRSVITFPTCWDGKNLDSPDHESHVTYAAGVGANDVGPTGRLVFFMLFLAFPSCSGKLRLFIISEKTTLTPRFSVVVQRVIQSSYLRLCMRLCGM